MNGEIITDGQNVAEIVNLGISLMAVEDKIIVMFDDYKSGYECKNCSGNGYLTGCTSCENTGKDRFEQPCRICEGKGVDRKVQCHECKGKGGILVIPETAKSLPTTGIVLSMGPETPAMQVVRNLRDKQKNGDFSQIKMTVEELQEQLNQIPIRLGARVIFGPHVGTMIPFKGNVKLKIMRIHEPLAVLFGKDTAARDFIDYETDNF